MTIKLHPLIRAVRCLLVFCAILSPFEIASALGIAEHSGDLPALSSFVNRVENGRAEELRGVYVPDLLAALVVQQPDADPGFVSPRPNVLTQFGLAAEFGSVGLLAHNYLAGEHIALLDQEQEFFLVYGDGRTAGFVVTGVRRFQALEPDSTSGRFVDLESGDVLSAAEMFLEAYDRPGQVVLQTCIEKVDQLNWGRMFVIAAPID